MITNRTQFIKMLDGGKYNLMDLIWNTDHVCNDPADFVIACDVFFRTSSDIGYLDVPKDGFGCVDLSKMFPARDGAYDLYWIPYGSKDYCKENRYHVGQIRRLDNLVTFHRISNSAHIDMHHFDDMWICQIDEDIRQVALKHA